MSHDRKRYKKKDQEKTLWPSWFIEPSHPVEEELVKRVLNANEELGEIYFTVHTMQVNYIVFRKNYEELLSYQSDLDQPLNFSELALMTEKGKIISQDAIIEFTRLLHNFLASAKMLVDVTRRWVKELFSESEFWTIYQNEVSTRFVNNVQAQFLEDLRNFTLHRSLPLSTPELRFQEIDEHTLKSSVGVVLIKGYLLEWKEWSELAKLQFGMALEREIDIMFICGQYYENVTEFTQWLFWQVREQFNSQIKQINDVLLNVRNRGR